MTFKVDYFFVGAPKCGTTSLHSLLGEFGNFDCGKNKEPHYFSATQLLKNSYYFDVNISSTLEEYHKNYTKKTEFNADKHAIDFSPSYLANTHAAEKIKSYNPNAKIVIILRNPVERSISHYLMDKNLIGFNEDLITLLEKPSQFKDRYYYEYIENSLYYRNIEKYFEAFDNKQIHIEIFEELFPLTRTSTKKLLQFLGINKVINVENINVNSFDLLSSPAYQKLRRYPKLLSLFRKIPDGLKDNIKNLVKKKNVTKPDMSDERKYLTDTLLNDYRLLEKKYNIAVSRYWKSLVNNG